jgi:hypothetical protein
MLTSFALIIVQCKMSLRCGGSRALPTSTKHRSAALEEEQDSRFGRSFPDRERATQSEAILL